MTENKISMTATADDHGKRLDKWLANTTELSRSRIQTLMASGAVKILGYSIKNPSQKVLEGQTVSISVPPPLDPVPRAEDIPLDIFFEDDDLLIVNKPAGMTVHPAPGWPSGTLVNALIHHAKDSLSGIGGVARPGIVHRIDKDTSGLLVVAKNDKAHQHLSAQFAKHSVHREYICFVRGQPREKEGRVESRLARSPQNRKKQAVVKGTWGNIDASEHGRHAITNYKVTKGFGQKPKAALGTPLASMIECRLETGRTHQIRVHMAHLSCPLLGDPLYGKGRAFMTSKNPQEIHLNEFMSGFNRQALHARSLGFVHPISGEYLEFNSNLPADLLALQKCLLDLQ